jgi:hypothetical protein
VEGALEGVNDGANDGPLDRANEAEGALDDANEGAIDGGNDCDDSKLHSILSTEFGYPSSMSSTTASSINKYPSFATCSTSQTDAKQ